MPDRRAALREIAWVFGGVSALIWLVSRAERVPFVRDNLHLFVAALFGFTAIRLAERQPGGLSRYGLALGGVLIPERDEPAPADSPQETPGLAGAGLDLLRALLRAVPSMLNELAIALAVCAVIFPPFIYGFYRWNAPVHPFVFLPQAEPVSYALTQIIVVALPEEMFFRGYLQGRLSDAFPERLRLLGAPVSLPAWLIQAALFGVLHFAVDLSVPRLAVFFPALLFGWLAFLRGGIGAAVFVHAFCNLLSDLLARGWL